MTLLLEAAAIAAVAAFGWMTMLYFDARAEYRGGLRLALGVTRTSPEGVFHS